MVTHIYELKRLSKSVRRVLEEMRKRIALVAGITLVGNRLTIRFGDPLCDVHMVILEVEDGQPETELSD
jgi:hypothetical protein